MNKPQIDLQARSPFSFSSVVRSHGWAQLVPFSLIGDGNQLAYIAQMDSGKVVELHFAETSGGVGVTFDGAMNRTEQEQVEHVVSWMFGLDQDFSAFYALARQEPKLQRMAQLAQGRVLRSPSLFEDVVKTILTTNTLWAATKRMCRLLVEQFGAPLAEDPARCAFPVPASLAASDEATLRAETRLGYRAPYILELAQKVASEALDLEALKDPGIPTLELRKRLLAIKGVGGYAAANLLMILGRYDSIPVDSWAMKSVSHEWHDDQPVGKAEVEAAFERWGEWKGLAYWFWEWRE